MKTPADEGIAAAREDNAEPESITRELCDDCQERPAEFVYYCRCMSRGTRGKMCGNCIPKTAERVSPFAFRDPLAECDECHDDAEADRVAETGRTA